MGNKELNMVGPFQKARTNADTFVLNIASLEAVQSLLERSRECSEAKHILDWREDEEDRAALLEAMKEQRQINAIFIKIGEGLEKDGISA